MKRIDASFVKECDSLIKLGKGKQVLETIQQVPIKWIPRSYLSQIGSLLNRVGGSYHCLKVLHGYVRGAYFDLGNEKEKTEYAKALIEIGAQNEGLELIESLPVEKNPSLLLTKAFCHFKSWDYEKALPLVITYTNSETSDYQVLVGKINLASIYINLEKYDHALSLLLQLEKQIKTKSQRLLKGYILEQLGQIHFFTNNYTEAQKKLKESIQILKASNQKALLYPKKWQALIDLKINDDLDTIKHVRKQNQYFNDYETLRDIDYWQAKILKSKEKMTQVYYNTPYPSFKKRILSSEVNDQWSWQTSSQQEKNILDLFGPKLPRVFELTSQLFCHLLSDGYKPMTIGSIHSKLFDEYFNPFSSPDRIYQILSRLNKKLKTHFSYQVDKIDHKYIVVPQNMKNFNYFIYKEQANVLVTPRNIFIDQVKSEFANQLFSAKELSLKYQVSSRTANRWLKELTDTSKVLKLGTGRKTKYKLAS